MYIHYSISSSIHPQPVYTCACTVHVHACQIKSKASLVYTVCVLLLSSV